MSTPNVRVQASVTVALHRLDTYDFDTHIDESLRYFDRRDIAMAEARTHVAEHLGVSRFAVVVHRVALSPLR